MVAEVGKEQITVRQVQGLMQNVMRSRRFPPEMVQHYVPQLIDQMITERAVAFQAESMGFRVSDEDVANAIRSMLPQMLRGGEFDRNVYRALSAAAGSDRIGIRTEYRTNLLLLKLQNIALEGAIVTPGEVEASITARTTRSSRIRRLDSERCPSQVTVTAEEIKTYYDQNKPNSLLRERRSFHLLIADEAKIGAGVDVPEAICEPCTARTSIASVHRRV